MTEDQLRNLIASAGIPGTWFAPEALDEIPDSKGAYILLLRLSKPVELALPRLAQTSCLPGWFAYAGSANGPGGIRARVRRHFRPHKKLHWHIDRLTEEAAEIAALPVVGGDECQLIGRLHDCPGFHVAAKGFGSSDCRTCDSHLLAIAP